jgi:hypothetical protein
MKNLILAIIVFFAFFTVSFTINTGTVNAKTEATVTSPGNDPYYVVVYHPQVKITFEYDGPGGKLINIAIEHLD